MAVSDYLGWIIRIAAVVLGPLLIVWVTGIVLHRNSKRWPKLWRGWRRIRMPFGLTLAAIVLRSSLPSALEQETTARAVVERLATILLIAAMVWLIATVVLHALTITERRLVERLETGRDRRRAHTQLRLIRRLVTVAFVIIAVGAILLTFPQVRGLGAGLLASAGLLSIVAGVAAQSSLSNLFAGIQIAFSDMIRIDDVVVVEGEWGNVEDITLTYVVVRIWDERRLILPSIYFTTTPYTNWTRTGTEIVGPVLFELDWRADVDGMREQLNAILSGAAEWDGRQQSLVVTDTTGGRMKVRAVMSAADSDDLWVLQCLVRERMVAWLRKHNPEALPVDRIRYLAEPADGAGPRVIGE